MLESTQEPSILTTGVHIGSDAESVDGGQVGETDITAVDVCFTAEPGGIAEQVIERMAVNDYRRHPHIFGEWQYDGRSRYSVGRVLVERHDPRPEARYRTAVLCIGPVPKCIRASGLAVVTDKKGNGYSITNCAISVGERLEMSRNRLRDAAGNIAIAVLKQGQGLVAQVKQPV